MTEEPQWEGRVLEVWGDGDTFTAELWREEHPELLADFSMAQCEVTVQAGDLIIVTPASVTKRELGKWTKAELDSIMRRARRRAKWLQRYCD